VVPEKLNTSLAKTDVFTTKGSFSTFLPEKLELNKKIFNFFESIPLFLSQRKFIEVLLNLFRFADNRSSV
jgi:hypothetical protein